MENWAWDWLSGARGSHINRLAQACANLYEKCVWEPPNTKKRTGARQPIGHAATSR